MRLHPELQRNLWLEFSLPRLLAMPCTIGILCYLFAGVNKPGDHSEPLMSLCVTLFALLVGLWGGRNAADAVVTEINEGTWDFQRLSSLSPFGLAMGKLFGSTSYAWYGGLMLAVIYAVSAIGVLSPYYILCSVMLMLEAGLICHAAAMFSSLQSMQQARSGREKIRSVGHHMYGILAGLFFITSLPTTHHPLPVYWYDTQYDYSGFAAAFGIIFLLWLFTGIHAQMRAHLQLRGLPWRWTAFVIFMVFFLAGFGKSVLIDNKETNALPMIVAFSTSLFFFYGTAFIESWGGMGYRRMQEAWQQRKIRKAIALSPRWLVSFIICALITVQFAVVNLTHFNAGLFALTLLCFAIRDVAILHYFRLNTLSHRAMMSTAFWLVMLYLLIPLLLNAIGLKSLSTLLLPVPNDIQTLNNISITLISGMVQGAVAIWLARKRWKQCWQAPKISD